MEALYRLGLSQPTVESPFSALMAFNSVTTTKIKIENKHRGLGVNNNLPNPAKVGAEQLVPKID
jgi:hypothetical protein